MSIATNLKRKRMDKQLTQKELAKKTGVSLGLIFQIEQGLKIPSLSVTVSLAKVLGCKIDELVS